MTNTLPDPMASGSDTPWPTIPVPHTALAGPANADNFRTFVGRSKNRWYIDPLVADDKWSEDEPNAAYPAISTVKKAVGQDWSLVACKRIAEATVKDPQRFVGKDFTDIYEQLKADNERGLRHASNRGTNVHTYFEKGLYGQDITYSEGPHEPGADYLPAVREFFAAYQPTLVAAISRPPSAGPSTDAVWNMIVLRLIAFGRCSRGTSVGSSACRDGRSNALTAAPIAARM